MSWLLLRLLSVVGLGYLYLGRHLMIINFWLNILSRNFRPIAICRYLIFFRLSFSSKIDSGVLEFFSNRQFEIVIGRSVYYQLSSLIMLGLLTSSYWKCQKENEISNLNKKSRRALNMSRRDFIFSNDVYKNEEMVRKNAYRIWLQTFVSLAFGIQKAPLPSFNRNSFTFVEREISLIYKKVVKVNVAVWDAVGR